MKKIISVLLVMIMVSLSMPTYLVSAESEYQKMIYSCNNNFVTIEDCSDGISGEVSIPQTIDGYTVTIIGSYAFDGRSKITSLEIPDGVEKIEYRAFRGSTGLTEITIPDSVTEIGDDIFKDCSNLKKIRLSNNIDKINSSMFSGCTSLEDIVIPESVKTIGSYAFDGRSKITSLEIPDGVEKIEYRAFRGCTGLTEITIPDSVTEIGDDIFKDCSNLKKIRLSNNIDKINSSMFSGCTSLEDIVIPESVKTIGSYAFDGRSKITSLEIPDGVEKIEYRAFRGCTGLTEITIPDSVTEIGDDIFKDCNIVVYGNENSAIHQYCEKNDIDFIITGHTTTTKQETQNELLAKIKEGAYQGTYRDEHKKYERGVIIEIENKQAHFISYPLNSDDEVEAYEYYMNITYDTKKSKYFLSGLSDSDELKEASEMFGSGLLTHSVDGMYDIYISEFSDVINGELYGTYTPGIFSMYGEVGTLTAQFTEEPEYPEINRGDFEKLLGTYNGTYTADQGKTGGSVTIKKDGGKYYAEFSFYPLSENPDVESGSYRMQLSYNSLTKKYSFVGEKWIDKAPTYEFVNLIGAFNGDVFSGDVYRHSSGTRTGSFKFEKTKEENGTLKISTNRPQLSLMIGENMLVECQLIDEKNVVLSYTPNVSISISNPQIARATKREDTGNSRIFNIEALGQGTTDVSIKNIATNEVCTFSLTVNSLAKNSYTISTVPTKKVGSDWVNFYNFSGMYIDSYKYEITSDDKTKIEFDVYNTTGIYGSVEVYNSNGEFIDYACIDKFVSNITSLKDAFWDRIGELGYDVINGNMFTYRQEFGCSKKTHISVIVPKGGYIKITNDSRNSFSTACANSLDIFASAQSIASNNLSIKQPDLKSTNNFILELKSSLASEMLQDGKSEEYSKKMVLGLANKSFVSSKTAGTFLDTIYENIYSLGISDILEVAAVDVGVSIGENIFKKMSGPYGTILDLMFLSSDVANITTEVCHFKQCFDNGAITIQVPSDYMRTCQGISVESKYVLNEKIALDCYSIPKTDEEIEEMKLKNNRLDLTDVKYYNISLVENGKEVQPAEPVCVTINLTGNYINNINKVSVYRLESNGALTNMNAVAENNKLKFTTEHFSTYIVAIENTVTSFNSPVSDWAKEEVEEAYDENLVPEVLVGKDLTQKVDRAEFAAIAVALYENLTGSKATKANNPFNDIYGNACEDDILKAYNLDITTGTSATTFEPNINITREQMATMLTRAYKKSEFKDWTIAKDADYPLNFMGVQKFADDNEISDYAKESVYFMARWDIIKGVGDNKFAPKNSATLGESYGYATREQAVIIALRSAKHL